MIRPPGLRQLLLALSLGAMPLHAQTEPDTSPGPATRQNPSPADRATTTAGTPPPAQGAEAAPAGTDSPFDYRPSEEISEDLPVSFPVDI